MREERKLEEKIVLDRLAEPLKKLGIHEYTTDELVVDRPDIVFEYNNRRIGIEVTRLDYESYCKWLNYKPDDEWSRLAEITVNLKKMLESVKNKKWPAYIGHIKRHNLDECWLILHNNVFDMQTSNQLNNPDINWIEKHARFELQDLRCPYDRVLFNLENPNKWYYLYDKTEQVPRTSIITQWPTIVIKEIGVQSKRGVNIIDLGNKNTYERKEFGN